MKNIFYEVIDEAKDGKVIIDGEEWPIFFSTIIYNDVGEEKYNNTEKDSELCTLLIKDEEKFFDVLERYIELEISKKRKSIPFVKNEDYNLMKYIMIYLFANATTEDFKEPIKLIERNIDFLQDDVFSKFNHGVAIELDNVFSGNMIEIRNINQSISMETVNKIDFSISDGLSTYSLPSISYGITLENGVSTCFIYSILNKFLEPKNDIEKKYQKKISRILYKINENITSKETTEYLEYIRGESLYYPENVSDVSPSAVLSLSTFLSLLKNVNIEKVKAVPYLSLRYSSRQNATNYIKDEEKKKNLIKRNDFIQKNITDKFIRTFRRVEVVMDGVEISSYPYELDEFLTLKLDSNKKVIDNKLLQQVSNKIKIRK